MDLQQNTIDRKVEAEMIRMLYRSAGFGLFSNFFLAAFLVGGTFHADPLSLHAWWLSAIVTVSMGRLGLNIAFKRAAPPAERLEAWRNRFFVGVVVAAVFWGLAGWFYFQTDQAIPRLLIVTILVGLN